jgi:hypothetical protein
MSLSVPKDTATAVEQLTFADLLPGAKQTEDQGLIPMTIIASGAW